MSFVAQTVYVIDDDSGARESVRSLATSNGIHSETYESAEAFFSEYHVKMRGCLVTDLQMPGLNGADLQKKLVEAHCALPIIVITAYASTPLTVELVRRGALTVLEKPCLSDALWIAIQTALTLESARREKLDFMASARSRFEQLHPKETDVLELVVAGVPNKLIAAKLGVSTRTVENRRAAIFEKTETQSVAELVRLVMEVGVSGLDNIRPAETGDEWYLSAKRRSAS